MLSTQAKKILRLVQVLLIAAIILTFWHIRQTSRVQKDLWRNYHTTAFNTVCSLRLRGSRDICDETARKIIANLFALHRCLNRFDATSELSRFNAAPPNVPFSCSPLLWGAFQSAREAYHLTDGAFDVTILPLLEFWKGHPEGEPSLRNSPEFAAAREKVGFSKLQFDEERHTVTKLAEGVRVDFGGLAKGLALDGVRQELQDGNIPTFIIDLGGNLTLSPDITRVDITDPTDRNRTLCTILDAGGRCIATSSNSERAISPGKVGHIINPATGETTIPALSATAITRRGVHSDIFSTAVFIGGTPLAKRLSERVEGSGFVLYPQPVGSALEFQGTVAIEFPQEQRKNSSDQRQ